MLAVPLRKQEDETACLPTCVAAVLGFLGYEPPIDDVRYWCRTTERGSDVDLAIQGLNDAGVDAELLQCATLDELQPLLDEGRRPIVILSQGGGWSHSVVVCAIEPEAVVVMEPRTGGYLRIGREAFLGAWTPLAGETVLVGGAPEDPPSF